MSPADVKIEVPCPGCGENRLVRRYDHGALCHRCNVTAPRPRQVTDLNQRRFGKLVPLREEGRKAGRVAWLCRCDCGVEKVISSKHLLSGSTVSCGCHKRRAGGLTSMACYSSWKFMWMRCTDRKQVRFHRYGGRGIGVCDRWKDFAAFLEDMGHPPPRHTLDRIDGNKGYDLANCRWATRKEQARNTCRNRYEEMDGQRRCVAEWAELHGLRPQSLIMRLNKGIPLREALTMPWGRWANRGKNTPRKLAP